MPEKFVFSTIDVYEPGITTTGKNRRMGQPIDPHAVSLSMNKPWQLVMRKDYEWFYYEKTENLSFSGFPGTGAVFLRAFKDGH